MTPADGFIFAAPTPAFWRPDAPSNATCLDVVDPLRCPRCEPEHYAAHHARHRSDR